MTAVRELPKATPALTMETITVTPAMAEKWLGHNLHNRNVRPRVVAAYARAMQRGEWMLTGEAVKFAHNGDLIDGQHRLYAIVESQTSVKLLVVKGLLTEAQDVLDTGCARTAGDQLGLHGHASPQLLAATAKIVVLYETGRFYVDAHRKSVSHREIIDRVSGDQLLAWSCNRARGVARDAYLRPSVAAAVIYELMKVDDEKAEQFFDRLADGVELPAGSAIIALRSRLRTIKDERTAVSNEEMFSLVVRTWNHWRSGRKLATLPMRSKGEAIPCPVPK